MSTLLVFTSDAAHRKDWEDAGMPPVFLYDLTDLEAKATELREAMLRSRLMRVVVVLDQVYFHLDCRPLILHQFSEVVEAFIFTMAPEDFVDREDLKKQETPWPMFMPRALRSLDGQWLFSSDLSEKSLNGLQRCFPALKEASVRKALLAPSGGFRSCANNMCFQTTPGPKEIPISYEMASIWDKTRPA